MIYGGQGKQPWVSATLQTVLLQKYYCIVPTMELETPGRFFRGENNYLTDFYLRSREMYVSGLICISHYSIIEMRKPKQFWPILYFI